MNKFLGRVRPYPSGQKRPWPVVGAFIFNQQGEFFVIKTSKWFGKWAVPGGKVELGEKMTQALKREVKEETGLIVSQPQLVAVEEFIFEPSFFQKRHFIFFDYFCRSKPGQVKLDPSEADEYKWVKPAAALRMPLEVYTRRTLQKIISQKLI